MPLKSSVLEGFKRIVGETNVLTDAEDLYVYSFEHYFRVPQHRRLDVVVRVSSDEQERKVTELAEREGLNLVRRGAKSSNIVEAGKAIVVLLDNAVQPELETVDIKKELRTTEDEKIHRTGHGTFRNLALALKFFLSSLPAQKCIDCNVCSGYCTVSSSFNGIETWSSKGRTLLTQALFNGALQSSLKLVDVLYTCSLCGLCFAQCFETTQVRKAIMDARYSLAEKKRAPELFARVAKNIFDVGDPGGMPSNKRVAWTEQLKQKGFFPKRADVLYWVGCVVSTRTPNTARALGNVLNRAQVDFTFLGEREGCCGYVLLAAGLWSEARENAAKLFERVKATRAETVVTPCAGCYYTFTKMYPEILNIELPCRVMHASQYVECLIEESKIVPRSLDWKVTYHDPCSLGRHSNIFASPRNVLNAVPDLEFIEMTLNKKRARCCGAGGGLWSFNNSVAMSSATERLVKDAAPLGVSGLITTCPTCHINFRYASVKKSIGIKVYDITEVIEASISKVA